MRFGFVILSIFSLALGGCNKDEHSVSGAPPDIQATDVTDVSQCNGGIPNSIQRTWYNTVSGKINDTPGKYITSLNIGKDNTVVTDQCESPTGTESVSTTVASSFTSTEYNILGSSHKVGQSKSLPCVIDLSPISSTYQLIGRCLVLIQNGKKILFVPELPGDESQQEQITTK